VQPEPDLDMLSIFRRTEPRMPDNVREQHNISGQWEHLYGIATFKSLLGAACIYGFRIPKAVSQIRYGNSSKTAYRLQLYNAELMVRCCTVQFLAHPVDFVISSFFHKIVCSSDNKSLFIYLFILFIQFINQQWHRGTRNGIEVQAKNILAEWPTQG